VNQLSEEKEDNGQRKKRAGPKIPGRRLFIRGNAPDEIEEYDHHGQARQDQGSSIQLARPESEPCALSAARFRPLCAFIRHVHLFRHETNAASMATDAFAGNVRLRKIFHAARWTNRFDVHVFLQSILKLDIAARSPAPSSPFTWFIGGKIKRRSGCHGPAPCKKFLHTRAASARPAPPCAELVEQPLKLVEHGGMKTAIATAPLVKFLRDKSIFPPAINASLFESPMRRDLFGGEPLSIRHQGKFRLGWLNCVAHVLMAYRFTPRLPDKNRRLGHPALLRKNFEADGDTAPLNVEEPSAAVTSPTVKDFKASNRLDSRAKIPFKIKTPVRGLAWPASIHGAAEISFNQYQK
jgi:hypothetical protein